MGERKVYTLAYADDIVLLAEEEDGEDGAITGEKEVKTECHQDKGNEIQERKRKF